MRVTVASSVVVSRVVVVRRSCTGRAPVVHQSCTAASWSRRRRRLLSRAWSCTGRAPVVHRCTGRAPVVHRSCTAASGSRRRRRVVEPPSSSRRRVVEPPSSRAPSCTYPAPACCSLVVVEPPSSSRRRRCCAVVVAPSWLPPLWGVLSPPATIRRGAVGRGGRRQGGARRARRAESPENPRKASGLATIRVNSGFRAAMTWQEAQDEREHSSASPASSALATCLEALPVSISANGCGGRSLQRGGKASNRQGATRKARPSQLGLFLASAHSTAVATVVSNGRSLRR